MADTLKSVGIPDMIIAISELVDWTNTALRDHNKRVAFLSYALALEMNLSSAEINNVVLAAMIHDVGILSYAEQASIQQTETVDWYQHATYAYEILKDAPLMKDLAEAILHHHTRYDSPEHETVSIISDIIHVADRIDILSEKSVSILAQSAEITLAIGEKMESEFNPLVVLAFMNLAESEAFWLSAARPQSRVSIVDMAYGRDLSEADKMKIFKCICELVDFRSSYTATHSTGVTTVATLLAQKANLSNDDVKIIYIAGLLHDIGKLSISSDILEKAGVLSDDEFRVIKVHPFLTHIALDHIPNFEQIETCASRHHENLNGTGYPYRYTAEELSLSSQIMRISDIYTAIVEDRPYRPGAVPTEAIEKLFAMVRREEINGEMVELLEKHIVEIDEGRKNAQEKIHEKYVLFVQKLRRNT